MNRFKISTRVGVLALLLSLLTVFVGALGLWGIAQSNQALEALHAEYGEDRYRPSPLLRRKVREGGRFR